MDQTFLNKIKCELGMVKIEHHLIGTRQVLLVEEGKMADLAGQEKMVAAFWEFQIRYLDGIVFT